MPRPYPPRICLNPECKISFTPHRRNQLYCCYQCRINFNNDKRRVRNLTDYSEEKKIRRNEQILIKALSSQVYKNDQISTEFLEYENFDFNVSSGTSKNRKTGGIIRWCHTHGTEFNSTQNKIAIHKKVNPNSHDKP